MDPLKALAKNTFWISLIFFLIAIGFHCEAAHASTDRCQSYRQLLTKESQDYLGVLAPVPMFMGQVRQESGCRDDITAWDNGRGAAQFMDATASMVAKRFPELGPPDPYNRRWAIRALVRFDDWNYQRVKGKNDCEKWGGALKGYNAGVGYTQRAQKTSVDPTTWFGVTEYVQSGQSAKNFEYSRLYPRWILFKHQPLYTDWGPVMCQDLIKAGQK
jgi:hypothetical protein